MKRSLLTLTMLGVLSPLTGALPARAAGDTARSPIEHTIIVYQENISFDHYFGTFGHGANGIPAGSSVTHSPSGIAYTPFQLDGRTQGTTCDVDHNYSHMIQMVDHGAMDKFTQYGNDKAVTNPSSSSKSTCPTLESQPAGPALALGYYAGTQGDSSAPLQNYWDLASHYTLADNFFQGVYGPSTPGAEWLVAATNNTDGDPNPTGDACLDYPAGLAPQAIPNLGQEASQAGVSWAWFQGGFGSCAGTTMNGYSPHHDPFQYFTSTADLNHTWANDPNFAYPQPDRHQRDLSLFYDALNGTAVGGTVPTLPAISWVKAPAADDGHPGYSGPAQDDQFIADLVQRVKASDYWGHTAIVVAFDETGGWWDHVSPPQLPSPFNAWNADGTVNTSSGCQYPGTSPCSEAGLGPRMPVLVISPHVRKHFVDHDQLETASLDQWVEWNYGLPALGVWGDRDVNAGSLRGAFDF